MTAGAEKSRAGCARRSPGEVLKDAGSIPATSTKTLHQNGQCADRRLGAAGAGCRACRRGHSPAFFCGMRKTGILIEALVAHVKITAPADPGTVPTSDGPSKILGMILLGGV